MTEPPERLNISKGMGGHWVAFNDGYGEDYIRADLVDAQDAVWAERVAALESAVAAARAEGWNAAINAAADEAEEHKHFVKGIDCCAECIRKMARAAA